MIDISVIPEDEPLRVNIGARDQRWPGWLATQQHELDLLNPFDWERSFGRRKADAFLCEHVLEHLTEADGRRAAALFYQYLKPGGYARVAVPDVNFPSAWYQNYVQIGGPGPADHPAADHKIVYDYKRFADVFASAGFEVDLLEYCDENGRFHYNQWSPEDGPIARSLLLDTRNQRGNLVFVSLILDARKPKE